MLRGRNPGCESAKLGATPRFGKAASVLNLIRHCAISRDHDGIGPSPRTGSIAGRACRGVAATRRTARLPRRVLQVYGTSAEGAVVVHGVHRRSEGGVTRHAH